MQGGRVSAHAAFRWPSAIWRRQFLLSIRGDELRLFWNEYIRPHEAERFFPLDEYIRPRDACSLAMHCGLALGQQYGMLCSNSH